MKSLSRKALPIGIILLSFLLALPFMNRSLQVDEASSIWFTHIPWSSFLHDFCDPHPPGYYLLLKGWLSFNGSPFWSRLPSLWATTLAIALTFRLGQKYGKDEAGLAAASLLAIHPLTAWYGTQARMYPVVQMLGVGVVLAGLWLFESMNTRQNWKRGLLFWLSASLLLWSDFTGWLVWGILQLWWIYRGMPQKQRWLSWQTAVVLPFLVLFSLLPAKQALSSSYQPVFVAVQAWKLGITLPPEQARWLILAMGGTAVAVAVIFAFWGPKWQNKYPVFWKWVGSLTAMGGWLFLLAFTAVPRLYTVKRLLVPILPELALAAIWGVSSVKRRTARYFILSGLWVGLLVSLLVLPGHPEPGWERAAGDLTKNAPEGALFWVDEMVVPVFSYYAGEELSGRWATLSGNAPLPRPEPGEDAQLFLIFSDNPYRPVMGLVPRWFRREYHLVEKMDWPGVVAFRLQKGGNGGEWWEEVRPSYPAEWGLQLPSPLASCLNG